MKLGVWLIAMLEPMLAKILVSLGFAVVSVVGMEAVINQVQNMLVQNMNALPADMLQLFLLAGGGKALGMILGAVATRVLLWQIQSSTKILGSNSG